jgi:hypothetical protein
MSRSRQVRLAGSILDKSRHVCAFFSNKEEEYRVLLPFILEGFHQGDRAVHIIHPRKGRDHVRRLEQAGIDVKKARQKDQLEIRSWLDTYLREGCFDQHRQIALVEQLLAASRARDFPLTRLVADMEWALEDRPGVADIIEYECRINHTLEKYEDAVCCVYSLERFSAALIMDAIRVHPAVIIDGTYQENSSYVPPDQFLRELQARRADTSRALG